MSVDVGEEENKEDKELKEERYNDGDNIKRFLNARMMSLGLEQVNSTSKYKYTVRFCQQNLLVKI